MKTRILSILLAIMMVISIFALSACDLGAIAGPEGPQGEQGEPGKDGEDGVGIKGITLVKSTGLVDTYLITYTNGATSTFTVTNGEDGKNGQDGQNGAPGQDGEDGKDGKDGIGIASVEVNADGELVLIFTNGTSLNLGKVVGADGKDGADGEDGKDGVDGEDGKDGVGIEKIELNANGDLVITLTNGTTQIVAMPKDEHVHTFGDWRNHNTLSSCEDQLYYHICSGCSDIEWRAGAYGDHSWNIVTTEPTCQAGGFDAKTCVNCGKVEVCNETPISDHNYDTEYTTDNSFHWNVCTNCFASTTKVEHTLGDDGFCSICDAPIGPTEGLIYELSDDETYAILVAYEGTATKIKIADEYMGVPVKVIYKKTFNNKPITSVIISNHITTIDDYAFSSSSLTSITIPESVISIGRDAFYDCDRLISISIPSSVTSIGISALSSCSKLTNISVDENNQQYKSIDGNLYSKDGTVLIQYAIGKKDTSFDIPKDVVSIGSSAFFDCDSFTSIVIPNNVTSIGNVAFFGCSNLTSVTIPDSVTNIESQAFDGCNSALYSTYEYGKYIGNEENPYNVLIAITNKNFSTYTIHEDTRIIAGETFSSGGFGSCSLLSNITIPDSVVSICNNAFWACDSLTSVIIGNGVISIGNNAFYHCNNLTSVTMGNNITFIGERAFEHCISLTSIIIPNSVTSIGEGAFYSCRNLTDVTIGNSVNYIGSHAFFNCDSITSIFIPDSVTFIDSYAFWNCDSIIDIIIPNSVTFIGDYAFANCNGLTIIAIPDSVTFIADSTFEWCLNITRIIIPDSVTSIGEGAFEWCFSLADVYYIGTEKEWSDITISSDNSYLTKATRYYYSETQPTTDSNFWHYDENGEIVVWGAEDIVEE